MGTREGLKNYHDPQKSEYSRVTQSMGILPKQLHGMTFTIITFVTNHANPPCSWPDFSAPHPKITPFDWSITLNKWPENGLYASDPIITSIKNLTIESDCESNPFKNSLLYNKPERKKKDVEKKQNFRINFQMTFTSKPRMKNNE